MSIAAQTLDILGDRQSGQDVRTQNVMACQAVANIVKSSLGPVGLDKMLVDDIGDVTITNDGATILKMLEVEHPAAKVLVELAELQDREVGDGTTSVVIVASELLKRANDLVRNGIHPTSIISGYRLAMREACKYVEEKLAVKVEKLGKDSLVNCAKTSMSSKLIGGDSDFFANLVVDAVQSIKMTNVRGEVRYPIKGINILKAHGKSVKDSYLLNGYALNSGRAAQGMLMKVAPARVACLDFNLQKTKMQLGVQVLVTDPRELDKIRQREADMTKERIEKLLKAGANVVLTTKGIDDMALKYFVEAGAIAVRRVRKEDMRHVAKATGATLVSTFADMEGEETFEPSFLGYADEVVEERIADDDVIMIKGTKNTSAVSLVLRGANDYMLDEMERALHDALSIVKRTLESNTVVAGGGAVESALSVYLEYLATTLGSREQLAIAEFAESLLIIPKVLAVNAAKDATELVANRNASPSTLILSLFLSIALPRLITTLFTMPTALTSLKRSQPSIKQLYLIQRLHSRHLSTPSHPNTPLPLITTSTSNTDNHTSKTLSRLFSGLAAGSTFVLLYWSLNDSKPTQFFSFADWSTDSKVNDRRLISLFPKLSLPDHSSNYIFGDAFRRKIFFNYEKRIRLRSPPEKVFEYFASFRTPDGEVLMKPEDLMRAVVPVFPPSESHLVRDGYLKGERNPGELRCTSSEFFMLFDVNNDGLISFKEYIFFATLLSIPESSFSVAFRMFDINNNGEIDKEEFKKVMALMRAQNRQGAVHRDGLRPGLKVHGSVENGGLVEHFFGKDGKARLRHDKFVQFMRDLDNEILRLEFAHYDYKLRGTISAKDFALSMVASADMSHLGKLLDRVDELNDQANLGGLRITFEEFKSFAELRKKLLPFSMALFSYGKVNGLLMREDFQRAASHVCGVSLSDNVVEIIFHLFDSNHDGSLSADEFVRVLHRRERDIAQPVESGLAGFLCCCFNRAANSPIGRFIS